MATATDVKQRNTPLREKKAQLASTVSFAQSKHRQELHDPEDSDYQSPENVNDRASMSRSKKRLRRKFRNNHSRKSRRLTYAVDHEVTDAEREVPGTARVGEDSLGMSDDPDHQLPREGTDHNDFSELPAATPPPATKSSSPGRKLSGAPNHDDSEDSQIPIQVILFNPDPNTPFIVLGTYTIAAETSRGIIEKAKNHVGFRGNYAEPNDHVGGQILIRAHNQGHASWAIVESSQLHDSKLRYLLEKHQPSSSGKYPGRVQARIRCLLHLESDVRLVHQALKEGRIEEI